MGRVHDRQCGQRPIHRRRRPGGREVGETLARRRGRGSPQPDPHALRPDHELRRGGLQVLRARLPAQPPVSGSGAGIAAYITKLRVPDCHELHRAGVQGALTTRPALSPSACSWGWHWPDHHLLHGDEPAGALARPRATTLFISRLRGRRVRDPAGPVRPRTVAYFALIALILFGILLIFVCASGTASYLLRARAGHLRGADHVRLPAAAALDRPGLGPALAASIFLDALNVFLFFLRIFSRSRADVSAAAPAPLDAPAKVCPGPKHRQRAPWPDSPGPYASPRSTRNAGIRGWPARDLTPGPRSRPRSCRSSNTPAYSRCPPAAPAAGGVRSLYGPHVRPRDAVADQADRRRLAVVVVHIVEHWPLAPPSP